MLNDKDKTLGLFPVSFIGIFWILLSGKGDVFADPGRLKNHSAPRLEGQGTLWDYSRPMGQISDKQRFFSS